MPIKWDDLLAGGAGAVDEALYGIPEWLLKKVNREGVEKYIKAHEPAYRAGEALGTVGSMFLPVPGAGLVKGLGLAGKVAKGVDTAADVARVADKGLDWMKLAKAGALSGAAEAGVRGVTSEKKPEQILADIASGGAFGAGGGVLGGVAAKALPSLTQKLAKYTGKQYLAGRDLSTKDLRAAFAKAMPSGAGPAYKAQHADDWVRDIVDYAKKEIPRGEGVVEAMSKKSTDLYKKLDSAWDTALKGVGADVVFGEAISPEDIARLTEQYGEDAAKGAIAFITKQSPGKKGLIGIKNHLSSIIDTARTNPSLAENVELSGAIQDLAGKLRGQMDDIAISALEKQGKGTVDIATLKKDYAMLKPFENQAIREAMTISRPGGGSPTAEKQGFAALASSLGAPAAGAVIGGASGAMSPEEGKAKLANIAIGSLGGALATKALSKGSAMGLGSLDTLVQKAAGKVPAAISGAGRTVGALVGGQAGSVISRKAIEQAAPSTPTEAEAATVGATAGQGDEPAYRGMIIDKMKAYAAAQGVPEDSEEFATFAQQVYAATDGFAPDKIANVLYTDPAERAAYMKALTASRTMAEVMPTATKQEPGLLGSETDEEKIQREAAVDQLASMVGDIAKERGSEAAAKKGLTRILAGNESPERKAELVKTLLEQYGVDLDQLAELGVS